MNATLAFELVAEMFYIDTGLLAPGKSWPLNMYIPIDLEEKYIKWSAENQPHIKAIYSFVNSTTEPEGRK